MTTHEFTGWRKSTRSDGGGNCVEVATTADSGTIGVRDSKNQTGPTLTFTPSEWTTFVDGVRDGEFDRTRPADPH